ncbi:MAG: HEAT repeat domain-containing protein [bacterium]
MSRNKLLNLVYIMLMVSLSTSIIWSANQIRGSNNTATSDMKRQNALSALRNMVTGFASYYVDFNAYPKTLVQLTTPIAYLRKIPDEPNGGTWLISYTDDSTFLTFQSSSFPEYTRYLADQKLLCSLPKEKLYNMILYDTSKDVRDAASYALVEKNRKERIQGIPEYFLDLAVTSSDTSIRIHAIEALSIFPDRLAFPNEYQDYLALLYAPEPEIRIATIQVFRNIISNSTRFIGPMPELLEVLATDSIPTVRIAMIQAVSNQYIKEPNRSLVIYSLTSTLSDPEIAIRIEAIKSLERFDNNNPNRTQIIKRLLGMIKDNNPKEQLAVIRILGTYRATESAMSLLPFLNSTNKDLKDTAITALCEIGDPDSIAPMQQLLGSEFNSIRISVIQGLSSSSNPKAVEILAKWLHDPNPDIRETVISSFRQFKSARIKPFLLTALQDTASDIRVAAVDALIVLEPTLSSWNYLKQLSPEDKLNFSRTEFMMMRTGLEAYYIDHNRYPMVQQFPFVLTTPVAYISYIPLDPYHETTPTFYRYYTPPTGSEWMLASDGPDQITDIDLSQVHYNPFQSENLKPYNYDPTNGIISKGDLWHQGP